MSREKSRNIILWTLRCVSWLASKCDIMTMEVEHLCAERQLIKRECGAIKDSTVDRLVLAMDYASMSIGCSIVVWMLVNVKVVKCNTYLYTNTLRTETRRWDAMHRQSILSPCRSHYKTNSDMYNTRPSILAPAHTRSKQSKHLATTLPQTTNTPSIPRPLAHQPSQHTT